MSSAVSTQWITLAPNFEGYLALPPAGRGPGLLLFQEIFGVNRHIRAVAEQYALDGFVVLAPDVFWRQTQRVELGYDDKDMAHARALMQTCVQSPADLLADIATATQVLRQRPETTGAKLGAFGYCMGGRLAYLAAATQPLDAAVAFYGGGIHQQLDRAAAVRCPMQFHCAGHDEHIPPPAVDAVRAAFAGRDAEVHVYADSHHGFNCWERGSYHAPSARLAHGRTLQFLARTLD